MIEEIKDFLRLVEQAGVSPQDEATKLLAKLERSGPALGLVVWNFDLSECPLNEKVLVSTYDDLSKAQVSQRLTTHWVYIKSPPIAWAHFPDNALEALS